MLGLELLDSAAIAVSLDDAGRVLARAECRSAADLQASAFGALEKVKSSRRAGLAVAAIQPESPASAVVMKALAAQFDGPFLDEPPIASGAAAAAAEAWTGAARGAKDVVFFAIGEHTMGGILRDGVPMLGAHRRAAAVAWLALNPVEREDYRKIGCLETEVATSGIVRRLIWRVKAGDASRVVEAAGGDLGAVTIDHVLEAARAGDGVSISVVRDTAKYVGMAAANLVLVADPEVLVLGGILASGADLLLDPVRTEIARRLPPFILQALTIAPAALGADAPAIGAARIAAVALQ